MIWMLGKFTKTGYITDKTKPLTLLQGGHGLLDVSPAAGRLGSRRPVSDHRV